MHGGVDGYRLKATWHAKRRTSRAWWCLVERNESSVAVGYERNVGGQGSRSDRAFLGCRGLLRNWNLALDLVELASRVAIELGMLELPGRLDVTAFFSLDL